MVRDLKIYPDPVLRETCRPVETFDRNLQAFVDDLAESMYFHKGVGLAAPQVGEVMRVAVVDVDQQDGNPRLIELINPEIVGLSEEIGEFEEGCLSFPDEAELVRRPARVTIQAFDREGASFELTADGLLATALQHEIDHLGGTLFIDHVSRLRRSLIDRRMKKRARAAAS